MANADPIIELFHEAKSRPAGAEREQFLNEACRENASVKEQIASLLEADANRGADFLKVTQMIRPTIPVTEKPGDRIGRYKLLEQIGEGGCGVVYMAEQEEPVRRRVALKVIKFGMDTKQVIARFEAERQALAMMDHPNIAKVLDGGATNTGRPFFVMELVRGIRITDYCDQNNLSTNERLELFIQVCQAIQHAHQKGIIHRDIKPSNILVTHHDDVAVPKVIDFGIAKATIGQLTDKTVFTAFAQFIGTPAYMSPEQAQMSGLDVDTRADIYSLGVVLYELLTGNTPFDAKELIAAGLDEMRRKIRDEEPARPSTSLSTMQAMELTTVARNRKVEPSGLVHLLNGDLDWLVMKCLEKDRTRRYETASALAMDLQRYLNDEPVAARPPSQWYRFQKLVRRNQLAFAAGSAIAALLVLGFATATWLYFRESDARKRAAAAEQLATQRLAEVSAERDAKEAAGREAEAISAFMGEIFRSPDPTRDGRIITVAETLDKAAKNVEIDLAGQPARQARLQATLANTYHALGLYRQACSLLEKVLTYHKSLPDAAHPDMLVTMHALANSYDLAGRQDEALKLREEVLLLRRKVLGPQHPDTLLAMNNLAHSCFDAHRRSEALRLREELLPLCRKVLGPEHPDTIRAMHGLAHSYYDAGRGAEALKIWQEVLTLRRKVLGPKHPDTLWAISYVAHSYSHANRQPEALKLREEALELSREVNGPEHPDTLIAMHNVAASYGEAGRLSEALELNQEVSRLHRKALGPEHPGTLWAMANVGHFYFDTGCPDKAIESWEEVLALRRTVLGPEHPGTLDTMRNLARAYLQARREADAAFLLENVSTMISTGRHSASEMPTWPPTGWHPK